jgi:glucosamine-6-phosphate deaminase
LSRPEELELIRFENAAAVADHLAERLWQQRLATPQQPLGLATGRTMEPVYAALVKRWHRAPETERRSVRRSWLSFNLDEYVGLAPGDGRSFAAFMQERLAGPLGLKSSQVRLPDGLAADPAAAAASYRASVAAAGGIGLQVLGLGLNGHVGFNEPPCAADAPCRCVALSATTREQNSGAFGGDLAAVPARAISLGLAEILAARAIVLVVTGGAKAAVLRRLLQDPPSALLPASWLRRHPAVTLLADQAALTLA